MRRNFPPDDFNDFARQRKSVFDPVFRIPQDDGFPLGVFGNVTIEQFNVETVRAWVSNTQALFSGVRGDIEPGVYTRLYVGGTLMMSDTPAEMRAMHDLFRNARGRGLITGLGLGTTLRGCLLDSAVEHVTVIELCADLIAALEPWFHERWPGRFTFVQADALAYRPAKGERYEFIWHDIWPDINIDNLPEYATLSRRWGRRCDWQGFWQREYLISRRNQEYREQRSWSW